MAATRPVLRLDDAVLEVLQRPVAVVVGTADEQLRPEVCRAWGPRWLKQQGQLEVLLPLPAGSSTLENVRRVPAIAFTFTMPTDYTAFQLKGRVVDQGQPGAAEWRRAREHFDAFLAEMPRVGLEPTRYAAWFPAQGALLRVQVDGGFRQAPGPKAGSPL